MEFLRFGSNIPGSYWGCCACCIIQNFKVDPKAKASIQLVGGDSSSPILKGRESLFAGPTYEDIFWQRIRSGTFDTRDMPNHAFIAILTEWQLANSPGKDWLAILKKAGFEFVRTVSNSVYAGQGVGGEPTDHSPNYIFMLVRNVGDGAIKDQFTPPKAWTDLEQVVPEPWEYLAEGWRHIHDPDVEHLDLFDMTSTIRNAQRKVWDSIPKAKFLTESQIEEAGAPVIYSGVRGGRLPINKASLPKKAKVAADPFAA